MVHSAIPQMCLAFGKNASRLRIDRLLLVPIMSLHVSVWPDDVIYILQTTICTLSTQLLTKGGERHGDRNQKISKWIVLDNFYSEKKMKNIKTTSFMCKSPRLVFCVWFGRRPVVVRNKRDALFPKLPKIVITISGDQCWLGFFSLLFLEYRCCWRWDNGTTWWLRSTQIPIVLDATHTIHSTLDCRRCRW